MKTICMLSILIALFGGCSSVSPKKTPDSGRIYKPTCKQIIYIACLATQTPIMKEQGEDDPEALAHFYCHLVANMCAKDPGTTSCKKDLRRYEIELNKKGNSLLHQAAHIGDHRLVESMINTGINIDYSITGFPDSQYGAGWTPLLIAVAEGNEKVVSVLIKNGANVNATNQLGRTSLMFASKYGFYSIAKILLENGARTNQIPNDKDGWAAIIAAAYEGHEDLVGLLISHGADANIQDKNGKTALMWAENQRNTKVVEILKAAH